MQMTNQFHFHNSHPNSNNNLGRTTCAATNLSSYFIPVICDNTHNDLQGTQSDGRFPAIGVPPPAIGILVVGVIGPTLKQLADSGCNPHNLTPALSPSMHLYAHWLLSWLQQSTRRVVLPSIVIIVPSLLHLHIRFSCTSSMPRSTD
jgi:hypothetical protein